MNGKETPNGLPATHTEGETLDMAEGMKTFTPGRTSRCAERVVAVSYGAPPALVSHRRQLVSEKLPSRRAFSHSELPSAGRAPRGEKTPLCTAPRYPRDECW